MRRFLIATALSLTAATALAADTDTWQAILHPDFKTLQVKVEDNPLAPPVIRSGSGQRIIISFDELTDEATYLRYELMHCDALWRPDGLVDSEFLDGFNFAEIDDYEYSRATLVHYVNYSLSIPNEQMQPLISGNYVVRVYPEDDPDTTILRARFSISEGSMGIDAEVTSRTDIDTNRSHQQLSFTVDKLNAPVDNLYTDLTVVVMQNQRLDNAVLLRNPQRVNGQKAVFEHLRPLIFNGGNEYRRMETVSTNYLPMGVAEISYADPMYHFTLNTDHPRHQKMYLYDQTQHGRFTIREYNSTRSDTEADYVAVHFSLSSPRLDGSDIYLDGDFTHRLFTPESRMVYNNQTECYESTQMLKQGAYNYQYLVYDPTRRLDPEMLEGNNYQTVNEYTILVYYRPHGTRYDRLAATATIYSGK